MDIGEDGSVSWRHLERHLWVATGPGGHLGTIEQGRRDVVVDTDGRVRGRCRSLDHAKALLMVVGERTSRSAVAA